MPHGRDHRNRACRDGADHYFLVEGPEVLDRAAAARDDHQVGPLVRRQGRETLHRIGHLLGRALALDQHGPDQDVAGKAIGQAVEDVADHRPGGRGDDADPARQEGQRALAIPVEQPLRLEPGAGLGQQGKQGALARDLHPLDDDLVVGAAGIGGELAGGDHLHPVLGQEGQALRRAAPHHPVEPRALVLEAEVEVARGRALHPGKLAAHPHEGEAVLDRALQEP